MRRRTLQAMALTASFLLASKAPLAQEPPPDRPLSGDGEKAQNSNEAGAAEASPAADPKEEARVRFERGKALLRESAWEAALAEFLESRRLYPTWSATSSAAFCLQQLRRFDEALATFELLLKDFADAMPADAADAARRAVAELRERVGTIEVAGAEVGAAISIDGRSRGDFPALSPLRVAAGSHVVRVFKEGFEPFETRVEVAGGETARVVARLRAFTQAGRLRVVEQSGRALEVLVDGDLVGETPWEGRVAIGEHVVVLRGEGALGTQPASTPVRLNELTTLTLAAEKLEASLRVVPTPVGAAVTLDKVTVGRGLWEGRVRAGLHTIVIDAEAFLPATRQVNIERGQREIVEVALEQDPRSARWRKPSRLFVELGGGVALATRIGDVGSSCGRGCTATTGLGFGPYGVFHGGYELGWGLSFGVAAGTLRLVQDVTQKNATIDIVADDQDAKGTIEDTLTLQGFLGGAWAGYAVGDRFPLRFRLGVGALLASVVDSKTGAIATPSEKLGRRGITRSATLVWASPEVRLGVRLGDHLEASAGVEALVLIGASRPRWEKEDEDNVFVYAGSRGAAQFPEDDLVGQTALLLSPSVAVRYAF